jgi:hypothetical protein
MKNGELLKSISKNIKTNVGNFLTQQIDDTKEKIKNKAGEIITNNIEIGANKLASFASKPSNKVEILADNNKEQIYNDDEFVSSISTRIYRTGADALLGNQPIGHWFSSMGNNIMIA